MDIALLWESLLADWALYAPVLSFGVTLGLGVGFLVHLLGYGVSSICSMMKNM